MCQLHCFKHLMLYDPISVSAQGPWDRSRFLSPEKTGMLIWWESFHLLWGETVDWAHSWALLTSVLQFQQLLLYRTPRESRTEELCWCWELIKFCGWLLKKSPGQRAKKKVVHCYVLFNREEKKATSFAKVCYQRFLYPEAWPIFV